MSLFNAFHTKRTSPIHSISLVEKKEHVQERHLNI